jgi:hypothetical protein
MGISIIQRNCGHDYVSQGKSARLSFRSWENAREENAWGQTFVFLSHLSHDDSVTCRYGTGSLNLPRVIRCFGVAGKQERSFGRRERLIRR